MDNLHDRITAAVDAMDAGEKFLSDACAKWVTGALTPLECATAISQHFNGSNLCTTTAGAGAGLGAWSPLPPPPPSTTHSPSSPVAGDFNINLPVKSVTSDNTTITTTQTTTPVDLEMDVFAAAVTSSSDLLTSEMFSSSSNLRSALQQYQAAVLYLTFTPTKTFAQCLAQNINDNETNSLFQSAKRRVDMGNRSFLHLVLFLFTLSLP